MLCLYDYPKTPQAFSVLTIFKVVLQKHRLYMQLDPWIVYTIAFVTLAFLLYLKYKYKK